MTTDEPRETPWTDQQEIDQLRRELHTATTRANALDVRADAAERLARVVADMPGFVPGTAEEADELTAALELWKRIAAAHHAARANDYSDAIQQLAKVKEWMPELDEQTERKVRRDAAKWGQTVSEWMTDTVHQHLLKYADE